MAACRAVGRADSAARRRDEPGRAVLQCRGHPGFFEVPEPHHLARSGGAGRPRSARHRARSRARRGRGPSPDVCARSGHAQPMHARRHDRQQLVRRPRPDGRQDRGQRARARRHALRRHADDRRVKTSDAELDAIIAAGGRQGQIYAGLKSIRDRFAPLIREKFPRIPRRVSGYNLDELLPENGFNVARALVGSEGHVCHHARSDASAHRKPAVPASRLHRVSRSHSSRPITCLAILTHKPIGLEGFDNAIPDSLRAKGMRLDELKLLPEGKGTMLVEFGAWTAEDADEQAEQFRRLAGNARPSTEFHRVHAAPGGAGLACARIRARRRRHSAGQTHTGGKGGRTRPCLPNASDRTCATLFALMGEYDYDSPLYGHFGDGCVHMRINFDLETEPGIPEFREFVDRAADIVIAHGGFDFGRTRRRPVARRTAAEDVRSRADGGVPRVQAPVGSRQQDEPRQADRRARAARRSCVWAPTIGRNRSRRISAFRTTTARSRMRRCAVSASARAARKTAA